MNSALRLIQAQKELAAAREQAEGERKAEALRKREEMFAPVARFIDDLIEAKARYINQYDAYASKEMLLGDMFRNFNCRSAMHAVFRNLHWHQDLIVLASERGWLGITTAHYNGTASTSKTKPFGDSQIQECIEFLAAAIQHAIILPE